MKFRIKNRQKPLNSNVDKSENVIASETEQVNIKKNKRKFPKTEVKGNDSEALPPKKSKKQGKIQSVKENNGVEGEQDTEVISEKRGKRSNASETEVEERCIVQSVKGSKKKNKKQFATEKEDAKEIHNEECDDENREKVEEDIVQSAKKSKKKKKKKVQPAIEKNNDAEEKQSTEIISENVDAGEKQSDGLAKNSHKNKKSKAQDKLERESRTIFIGNLPVNFNGKNLQKLIGKFGEIESFRTRGAIPECDKISKKVAVNKKMFNKDQQCLVAYVVFKNAQDAQNALNLNGQVFEERRLRVTLPSEKTFDKNKGIFIGNLRFKITEEEIWDFFKDCGEISSVRVIRDNHTGLCKGFGYVNFKSEDSVEFALKLDEEKLQDREIRIKRLFSEGKLEKLKKKKELSAIKNFRPYKNFNSKKEKTPNDKSGFNKKFKPRNERTPNDKSGFQKKFESKTEKTKDNKPGLKFRKKDVNKVDLKKKKLAEKLMAKPKKKAVSS